MILKKHWPLCFAILMILISCGLALFAYNSTDTGYAILASAVTFMFLFPLAGALIGGWYGWKMQSPLKWLLPFAVLAGVILYMLIGDLVFQADTLDISSYFTLGALPCLACLLTEGIAGIIARLIRNRKGPENFLHI